MNKTKEEQLNALSVGIAGLTILLILLMVIILFGKGISSDTDRESQVGEVSYTTQLESLAGRKGYTMGDKVTYNERLRLETEEGRYLEVMNYLGGVEVSDREFQEINDIQSNYQQSLKQVNESGKKDHLTFLDIVIFIVFCLYMLLLIILALK